MGVAKVAQLDEPQIALRFIHFCFAKLAVVHYYEQARGGRAAPVLFA
jgi:hypothetical protein